MPYEYRPYQRELLSDVHEALQEHQAVCAVLPTGGGKTICFTGMAEGIYKRGKTAWLLAHREELCDQMSEKLLEWGVPHGFIRAGLPLCNSPIKVGMIQTCRNKLHKLGLPPDLLVIDECHHTPATAYAEICASMPLSTSIVGYTATPDRADGKGLGQFFGKLVEGPNAAELISLGYLVPPRVFAPPLVDTNKLHTKMGEYVRGEAQDLIDTPTITGNAIEHYKKYADGTAAVVFCVTVDHAKHVAEQFNLASIPSAAVHGNSNNHPMSRDERRSVLNQFRDGTVMVLTTADLISEGFDLPKIETAILLRPTKSPNLYLQQVGRALRPAPGKTHATILDHVQNTMRHGMPDAAREWSLEGFKSRTKDDPDDMIIHTCTRCFYVYEGKKCPLCPPAERSDEGDGREFPEEKEGELVEVKEARSYLLREEIEELKGLHNLDSIRELAARIGVAFEVCRNVLIQRARTFEELQAAGRALGYKSNWAKHRHKARGGRFCSVCDNVMKAIPDFQYQCTHCEYVEHASELFNRK